MKEGLLVAGALPGSYAIDNLLATDLVQGQPIEIYLGGNWIPGQFVSSSNATTVKSGGSVRAGMYHISADKSEDTVLESSEESFPASDPPAWSEDDTAPSTVIGGPYFVAAKDGSICGLCTGMRVRVEA